MINRLLAGRKSHSPHGFNHGATQAIVRCDGSLPLDRDFVCSSRLLSSRYAEEFVGKRDALEARLAQLDRDVARLKTESSRWRDSFLAFKAVILLSLVRVKALTTDIACPTRTVFARARARDANLGGTFRPLASLWRIC